MLDQNNLSATFMDSLSELLVVSAYLVLTCFEMSCTYCASPWHGLIRATSLMFTNQYVRKKDRNDWLPLRQHKNSFLYAQPILAVLAITPAAVCLDIIISFLPSLIHAPQNPQNYCIHHHLLPFDMFSFVMPSQMPWNNMPFFFLGSESTSPAAMNFTSSITALRGLSLQFLPSPFFPTWFFSVRSKKSQYNV